MTQMAEHSSRNILTLPLRMTIHQTLFGRWGVIVFFLEFSEMNLNFSLEENFDLEFCMT
jgi:hypothetical protein